MSKSIIPVLKKRTQELPKIPRKDDALWKSVLEDVFEDFLCFIVPNARELFNFDEKFVYLDKEFDKLFPGEQLDEEGVPGVRFVDKLVKVGLRSGEKKYVLIHIEVQSFKGYEEPLESRMFRYFYRVKDKHNISIAAFAVLADQSKNYLPEPYQEKFLGTELTYKFNCYKLRNENEEVLRANPNPFAVVALVVFMALKHKDADDEQLLNIKIDLTKELIKRNLSKEKYNSIMSFLKHYVNFKKPETMNNFEQQVTQLTGRSTAVGINEFLFERRYKTGRAEGRQEGREEGIELGIEKGAQLERTKAEAEKLESARKLKNQGTSLEVISTALDLSIEQIENL